MNPLVERDIVLLTADHSFAGQISIRDQRVSDFFNNRHNTAINLRKVTVARLNDPSKVVEQDSSSAIAKDSVLIAFAPSPKTVPATERLFGFGTKQPLDVFIALDGMEVRGVLHASGAPELDRIITTPAEMFMEVTQATITLQANPRFIIQQDEIMVNVHAIRYLGRVGSGAVKPPAPISNTSTA